jgi:hypothetical protein
MVLCGRSVGATSTTAHADLLLLLFFNKDRAHSAARSEASCKWTSERSQNLLEIQDADASACMMA